MHSSYLGRTLSATVSAAAVPASIASRSYRYSFQGHHFLLPSNNVSLQCRSSSNITDTAMRPQLGKKGSHASSSPASPPQLQLCSQMKNTFWITPETFEKEVLQSELAICIVFGLVHSPLSVSYMNTLIALAEAANKQANIETSSNGVQLQAPNNNQSLPAAKIQQKRSIKILAVDTDAHPNLGSAFSVQRRNLPVTFFVLQGTIVDRVTGLTPKEKLDVFFDRFREIYFQLKGVPLTNLGFTTTLPCLRDDVSGHPKAQQAKEFAATSRKVDAKNHDGLNGTSGPSEPQQQDKADTKRQLPSRVEPSKTAVALPAPIKRVSANGTVIKDKRRFSFQREKTLF